MFLLGKEGSRAQIPMVAPYLPLIQEHTMAERRMTDCRTCFENRPSLKTSIGATPFSAAFYVYLSVYAELVGLRMV
jgi:hypothetical protein